MELALKITTAEMLLIKIIKWRPPAAIFSLSASTFLKYQNMRCFYARQFSFYE